MSVGTFHGHLSAEFPSQINIDVTEFCNLACIHCPYEAVTKIKGAARRNLALDLHRKLVDEIAEFGLPHCRYIRYTGEGEPLLHPQLASLIGDASARTGLPINLTTNGLLLSERWVEALLEAGVTVFDISLDAASADTYAQIRVKGDYDVAVRNVQTLIARNTAYGKPAKVVVSFVRQSQNAHEEEAFRSFWTAEGVDSVVMRNQHSCAGSIAQVARTMWAAAPAPRIPCLYPWERLAVGPTGRFSYCPADWMHEAEIGTLAENTVREVWQGPVMAALRQAHLSGDFGSHSFCGKCPDWSVISWPGTGRSYADLMRDLSSSGVAPIPAAG